jgi:hypothetical protein
MRKTVNMIPAMRLPAAKMKEGSKKVSTLNGFDINVNATAAAMQKPNAIPLTLGIKYRSTIKSTLPSLDSASAKFWCFNFVTFALL